MFLRSVAALAAGLMLAAGTTACRPDGGAVPVAPHAADQPSERDGDGPEGPGPNRADTAPTSPPRLVVAGELFIRERVSLPPGSTATIRIVRLDDGDAVAGMVASAQVAAPRQVPIPFQLAVDPDHVAGGGRFGLDAEIAHGGQTVFETAGPVPMELRGSSISGVKLLLRRTSRPVATPARAPDDPG